MKEIIDSWLVEKEINLGFLFTILLYYNPNKTDNRIYIQFGTVCSRYT